MKLTTSVAVLLIASCATAIPAPQNQDSSQSSQAEVQAQNQAQLDRFADAVQRLQNLANGLPAVTNITQQLLNELQQFRQSELFFGNPCSFFQMIFRRLYCTIASFDPRRTNTVLQGFLQFLNANQIFYNFASNFFCPFQFFGNLPGFGGSSSSSSSSSSQITCSNSGSTSTPNTNGNSNSLFPGFPALDSPQSF